MNYHNHAFYIALESMKCFMDQPVLRVIPTPILVRSIQDFFRPYAVRNGPSCFTQNLLYRMQAVQLHSKVTSFDKHDKPDLFVFLPRTGLARSYFRQLLVN